MVPSIKGDKSKQYPKFRVKIPWYTVSRKIRVNSAQSLKDIVPWHTVSREIRANSTQILGHSPMVHSIKGDKGKKYQSLGR